MLTRPAPAQVVAPSSWCLPLHRLFCAAPSEDYLAAQPHPPRHTFVLDFDGVLANSLDVTLEVIAAIAAHQGVPPVTAQEYQTLTMPQLKRRLKVRFYQIPGLIRRARAYAHTQRDRMASHSQALAALEWAQRRGSASLSYPAMARPPSRHL